VPGRTDLSAVALLLTLLAVACSSGHTSAAQRATDQHYVDGVKESATDISRYRTDSQLVKLGHVTCDGFAAHAGIEQIAGQL
jgi:hypothetical protein